MAWRTSSSVKMSPYLFISGMLRSSMKNICETSFLRGTSVEPFCSSSSWIASCSRNGVVAKEKLMRLSRNDFLKSKPTPSRSSFWLVYSRMFEVFAVPASPQSRIWLFLDCSPVFGSSSRFMI